MTIMRREIEDIRQYQMELLEMKNVIPEMKISLDRINSKLNSASTAEGKTSELKSVQ